MKPSNKERWLSSYPKRNTQNRYGTALSRFCDYHKVEPDQTLDWDLETIEDNLEDWKVSMIPELSGNTIRLYLTALTRWFKFNRKRIDVDNITRNLSRRDTYTDYPVTRDDLRRLLNNATLKQKVGISLIAFSGLRPVDVVTLQYRHIVESYKNGDEVLTIQKVHEKTEREYVSFLGHQGTRYLRDYLERRKQKGEKLTPDSFILPYRGKQMQSQGLRIVLGSLIDRTVGKNPTGNDRKKFRPYSLRKYFRHVVSKLGEDTAEYLMGHVKGLESMSATYNGLRDGHPEAIKQLKEQYISVLPELETEETEATINGKLRQQKEEQAQALEKQDRTIEELEKRLTDMQREQDELKQYIAAQQSRDFETRKAKMEAMIGELRELLPEGIENDPEKMYHYLIENHREKVDRLVEFVDSTATHQLADMLVESPDQMAQDLLREMRQEYREQRIVDAKLAKAAKQFKDNPIALDKALNEILEKDKARHTGKQPEEAEEEDIAELRRSMQEFDAGKIKKQTKKKTRKKKKKE